MVEVEVIYRISANSFRGNYSFLEVRVRKLFKGGNYSREETIIIFNLGILVNSNTCRNII